MRAFTTLLALTGLTALATAAPSYAKNNCGRCDTVPSGVMQFAQIPLFASADPANGNVYKCTTFGKEVRLTTCVNNYCGLCVMFKEENCKGDVLQQAGRGTEFRGLGARSFFCT